MRNLIKWLSRRRFPYEPLITVEVSRSRLLHNLAAFRKLCRGLPVAPVLKSNAYGHGLFEVADILERYSRARGGIPFFCVDSYFEAVALRARGFKTAILVIGYTRPEIMAHSRLKDTAFTVTCLDTLKRLAHGKPPCPEALNDEKRGICTVPHAKRIRIHLKIDTGMRRQGILPEEIDEAIAIIKDNDAFRLEGLLTHFSDAANPDSSSMDSQLAAWNRLSARFKAAFPGIRWFHAAATDSVKFSSEIQANAVRLGLGMYGLSEDRRQSSGLRLRPVLSMKTILTGVKALRSGETVGYGDTFKAPSDVTIATVPVGYFEGLDRKLSDNGAVQIGPGRVPCPIVGRVSMNIATIDVSGAPDAAAGSEAVIVSNDPDAPNSIESMARSCGTVTYELAVKIPAHLKRIVTD